jgi:hypothetical protein
MYLVRGGVRSAAGDPSAGRLLTEPLRELVDLAARLVAVPGLVTPRGDGHVVLVLADRLNGHPSTGPLRGFLRLLRYDACGRDPR